MKQTELVYEQTNGLVPFVYTLAGEWMYFCDMHIPQLFRYHLKKEKCECIVRFHRNDMNFYKIISHGDELWMLPFLDGEIVCFHIISREISYYEIPKEIKEKVIPFADMIFGEEEAYIFPHGNNRFLVEVDLQTHQMNTVELLKNGQDNDRLFFTGALQFQDKIYLTESFGNRFVLYDVKSKEAAILNNRYLLDNFWPKRIGRKIYFFPITITENKGLLIYDIDTNHFAEKENPLKNLLPGDVCITVASDEEIWILANKQKKLYGLDLNLEMKSEISILNFNEAEKDVYVSGAAFEERLFFNGFENGSPLIQVKDGVATMLDVGREQTLLQVYIDMVNKGNAHERKFNEINVGKSIYVYANMYGRGGVCSLY